MPNAADILWFKTRFADRIRAAIHGTPWSLDFIVAIACQETGEIWSVLRRKDLGEAQILALCVGDIIDSPKRSAFPRNKADLLAQRRGDEMFAVARKAFEDMARHIGGYAPYVDRPQKFCRGFGLFQRDLQFFRDDPEYFLQRKYETFEATLGEALKELDAQRKRIGYGSRPTLGIMEMAFVGIAYNIGAGNFRKERGLKQGYKPRGGKYYGENLFDFIRLSETVGEPGTAPLIDAPPAGEAIVPPPTPVEATGPFMRVDTRVSTLYLRSAPRKSRPPRENVVGELPDGHPVRAITGRAENGFMAVETSLKGALLRGYASTDYLVAAADLEEIPVEAPRAAARIPEAHLPARSGRITRRTEIAGALSLNEAGQPDGRTGADVDALRQELAAIVAWLDVDNPAYRRYKPRDGLTFCNIYAHDYCDLAGVYLPRVWWNGPALVEIARGATPESLIGATVHEMRANDLFRWLRDFGLEFGWRQTGSLTKLQVAANQGAIALIVARRKEDGRSGHIVPVLPETDDPARRARRNVDGEVTSPLQSQAGAVNFKYRAPAQAWWNGEQFAEFAMWIHP